MTRPLSSLLLVALLAAPGAAQVQLRGRADEVDAPVRKVSLEGVVVGDAPGGGSDHGQVIGWDLVRTIPGYEEAAAEFLPVADRAWRARSRLERGDWAAAEPLFEDLARTYQGVGGPTAAVVHEGLLRCRLRRGAQGAAVWAWLDWVGTLQASHAEVHRWMGGRTNLPAIRDSATELIPGLPPIWVGGRTLAVVAASEEWSRFASGLAGGSVTADLAALYRHAAAFEAGVPSELPMTDMFHPGVRLVAEVVASRAAPTLDDRRLARGKLERRLSAGQGPNAVAPEPWVEAWCRAAIGRSLVLEQDESLRRRGVRELLHLPARFADDHPYLAGVCLAEAAAAMRDMGEHDAASILLEELRRRFPSHPALAWEKLHGIGAPPQGAPAPAGAEPPA